ncbi:MAG: isopentenyl-diphosphate Delta-isomerase [Flavobacteriales bacterium]|nr:isopentenyl-diphosphate Delta-isomerase [Flavobacteriales bacterium]
MEKVILVDENDNELGTMEKMEAHEKALLHRAFSVFLFNENGEMLLQKRASSKYHSGGLWTNACCSHPRAGERTIDAATRRLSEEMGINANIEEIFSFVYKAELDKGLVEHEFDHVFFGQYEGEVDLNLDEADDFKYISMDVLMNDVNENPGSYTEWFKIALPKVKEHWLKVSN